MPAPSDSSSSARQSSGEDRHPLAWVLDAAARGRFPLADGRVEVLPPDRGGTNAVVALTGRAYVLTERPAGSPELAGADGFGGALHPRVLTWLAGAGGEIGSVDVVLARRVGTFETDGSPLAVTHAYDAHPRVIRARRHRCDVVVLGDEDGLVCVGSGLVDRTELAVELTGAEGSRATGRRLVAGALATRPVGEIVFAQVASGNAASLRMFLACGFVPLGSEVLIEPAERAARPDR